MVSDMRVQVLHLWMQVIGFKHGLSTSAVLDMVILATVCLFCLFWLFHFTLIWRKHFLQLSQNTEAEVTVAKVHALFSRPIAPVSECSQQPLCIVFQTLE
jgi:ABC-type transport system involved in Fe-S cluster assembly fused permease/ATPase subunit